MVKLRGSKSKKVTSAKRNKIERKKREHKRDLRKAAKSLQKNGMGAKRSKKSREAAKMALRISNADPDKEKVLERILQTRETVKVLRADARLQRREDVMVALAAKQAKDARRAARVAEGLPDESSGDDEDASGSDVEEGVKAKGSERSMVYIPNKFGWNFMYQFSKVVEDLVFPIDGEESDSEDDEKEDNSAAAPKTARDGLPSSMFLITCDARCAVQSVPWTLVDRIVDQAEAYSQAVANTPDRTKAKKGSAVGDKVLILFAMTKIDVVNAQTIGTQLALMDAALKERYANSPALKQLIFTLCPVSTQFDGTIKYLLRIVRWFNERKYDEYADKDAASKACNLAGKTAVFVLGLPNTGRRSLCRALLSIGTESAVCTTSLRAARIQQQKKAVAESDDDEEASEESEEKEELVKFVIPGCKIATFITLPEDEALRKLASSSVLAGDILFQSDSYVERMEEPEAVAMMIVNGVTDKTALAQAFCQPSFEVPNDTAVDQATLDRLRMKGAEYFLKGIGHTVRRDKGFTVSPLLVESAGTAGKLSSSSLLASSGFSNQKASLLDSTHSSARPGKFVHISAVVTRGSSGKKAKGRRAVKRSDGSNALRIGARTFIREFCQSRNVPWAVLAPGAASPNISSADAAKIQMLSFNAFESNLAGCKATPAVAPGATCPFAIFAEGISRLMKQYLVLLPNGVIEMTPSTIAPILHDVEGEFAGGPGSDAESDEEISEEGEEESDSEEGEEEEEGDEEDSDEEGFEECESGDEDTDVMAPGEKF